VNPLIRLDGSRFWLPRQLSDWPADAPRVCGVSSFSFGGSNVHAVLSAAPNRDESRPGTSSHRDHLLPLSARTEPPLRDLAGLFARSLAQPHAATLAEVCHTAGVGRAHQPHRLVVTGESEAEMVAALETWLRSGRHPHVQTGKAFADLTGKVAFLFTGQG